MAPLILAPRLSRFSSWLALLFACAAAAGAQPAYRVKDIATTTRSGSLSVYDSLAAFGSAVYFSAYDAGSREQLWKTDGTADGTTKLRDFNVVGGAPPSWFTAAGSGLFFFADEGLWRIDAAGDLRLVRQFPGALAPTDVAALSATIFFSLDDRAHGAELWKSDGTTEGTALVADLVPGPEGSGASGLTRVGDHVFFFAPGGSGGVALWKSDGTEAGTALVAELASQVLGWENEPVALDGLLFFFAGDAGDTVLPFHLWRSDGTAEGTVVLHDFAADSAGACPMSCPPYGPSELTPSGGAVLFVANDGVHGRVLWKSDGTPQGTALLEGVPASRLLSAGGLVYFSGTDLQHGSELWSSDGTPAGTHLVVDLFPGQASSYGDPRAALGDRLIFAVGTSDDLWITDGTPAGTLPVRDLSPGVAGNGGYPYGFTALGNGLVFLYAGGIGSGLWRTDGTEAGTEMVEDFETGSGSNPFTVADAGGRLLFLVHDADIYAPRNALWSSDGTEAGTVSLETFASVGTGPFLSSRFVPFAGSVFFAADDGEHGTELWRTDGTPEGTSLFREFSPGPFESNPYALTAAGSRLFFGVLGGGSAGLWTTDGTQAGTSKISDAVPTGENLDPVVLGSTLFFLAADGPTGGELWRSDGTTAGTVMVEDINPGPDWSSIYALAVSNGRLFFGAYDGAVRGLWTSDGTEQGTRRIAAIDPHYLTASGALVYFVDQLLTGLWRSDGTEEGTYVIQAIQASSLVAAGGLLYFTGDDGEHGPELWRSDGTEDGTRLVKDIQPGPRGGMSTWTYFPTLAAVGGGVVFAGNDGEHGVELWSSDGTSGGTVMLQDIAAGSESSTPASFTPSGGLVYFTADDGETGVELWAIPLAKLRSSPPRELSPLDRQTTPTRRLPERH